MENEKKCLNCNKPFTQGKAGRERKFCSDSCRVNRFLKTKRELQKAANHGQNAVLDQDQAKDLPKVQPEPPVKPVNRPKKAQKKQPKKSPAKVKKQPAPQKELPTKAVKQEKKDAQSGGTSFMEQRRKKMLGY